MIRPRWTVQRQCLCLCNCVRGDRPTGQAGYTTSSGSDQQWPLLRRKSRPANGSDPASNTNGNELQKSRPSPPAAATKGDSKNMLLITGLSPNLRPADFYRLAPNDLSSWQAGIKRVQQRHSRTTLEPIGTYQISFEHAAAARSYADNLARLHRLSRLRRTSPSGLWESTVPQHLLGPGASSPADELSRYAVAPPSVLSLTISRVRTTDTKWAAALAAAVEPLGYGPRPAVVVVRMYPPGLSTRQFDEVVRADGERRDMRWKVSEALAWKQPSGFVPKKGESVKTGRTLEDAPFIMAAESAWDVRGFHRYWDQRIIHVKDKDGIEQRYMVKTSIIEM